MLIVLYNPIILPLNVR